jgi:hypothetical protein
MKHEQGSHPGIDHLAHCVGTVKDKSHISENGERMPDNYLLVQY